MPLAGFELTIPASERPLTHALDRVAIRIGTYLELIVEILKLILHNKSLLVFLS